MAIPLTGTQRWFGSTVLFSVVILLFVLAGVSFAASGRALLISSYHPGFPTFYKQIEGLESVLGPDDIALDVEFMDSKRFYTPEDIAAFRRILKRKLHRVSPYDVVITADDNALKFVMDNHDSLFPETPVVFLGVNNQNLAKSLDGSQFYTGVIEAVSMDETLKVVWELCPKARTIYALVDSTPSGQGDLETFLELKGNYPGRELKILSLEKMTWSELGQTLEKLDDAAVLLLSAYRDRNKSPKSFEEAVDFLVEHSQAPVFHLWEHGIGQGLVGGKVISHYEQGRRAGLLARKILHGKAVSSLPVIEGKRANKYIFDYDALSAYGINANALPAGSQLLNPQQNLWKTHKLELLSILISILVLLFCGAILMGYTLRLRKVRFMLAKSNQRLNKAQQLGGLGDWEWFPETDIATWSENLYRMFMVPPHQAPPDYPVEIALYTPESRERLEKAVALAVESGAPYELELERRLPDGSTMNILARGEAERDAAGKTTRLFGSILDITAHKEFETKLRASEERYRQVVDSIQETLSVIAADGTFRFVNSKAAANLSKHGAPDDVIGKNIFELLPHSQAQDLVEEYQEVIATGTPRIREVMVSMTTGDKWFQNSLSPVLYGEHQEKCVLSLSLDITDRMQLIDHLAQYERVLESTSEMVAQVNSEHKYVVANKAFLEWTRKSKEEVIGHSVTEVLGPLYQRIYPLLDDALAGRRVDFCATVEHPLRGKRFLEASFFPVGDFTDGRSVAALIRDITDQKATREAFQESEERFRLTFEHAAVGMYLGSVDGRFMRVNRAFCNMTGYAEEELLDMTFSDLLHPNSTGGGSSWNV